MSLICRRILALASLIWLFAFATAQAFERPIIISTAVGQVKRVNQGVVLDLRILMRNDNAYDVTVDKGSALFGLEGYRVGAMQVKHASRLPAGGLGEVVLQLRGNQQQRHYIARTLKAKPVVAYAYKGYLKFREFDTPVDLLETSRFRVPARLRD